MEIGVFDNPKIKKSIIHIGREYRKIENGSKVFFHFVTRKCDEDKTVIDDSRKMGSSMELVIGKKFKLEVWEVIVRAMSVGEVSSFVVDQSLLYAYPFVSKTLREARDPKKTIRSHACAHSIHAEGLGFADLDDLFKNPCDLEFIIELLRVEYEGEYTRESWQLDESDRKKAIVDLKAEGNSFFKDGDIKAASEKYSVAIGYLDQLMLAEKPHDTEWNKLNEQKIPLLLNLAQCKLTMSEFYNVIELCSTVISFEPNNVKALYRRGRAHASVWNVNEARADLTKAAELDPSLVQTTTNLIKQLESSVKDKESSFKEKFKGKLFS